jgi:hypothetical protein
MSKITRRIALETIRALRQDVEAQHQETHTIRDTAKLD